MPPKRKGKATGRMPPKRRCKATGPNKGGKKSKVTTSRPKASPSIAAPKAAGNMPYVSHPVNDAVPGPGELNANLFFESTQVPVQSNVEQGEMSTRAMCSQGQDPLEQGSMQQYGPGSSGNQTCSSKDMANSLGEALFSSSVAQLDAFTAPVGTHVHLNLKNKIWKSEFVEFSDLLPQNRAFVMAKEELKAKCCSGFHWEQAAFNISQTGEGRGTRRKEIFTIGEWTDAMFVYMQIYLEKHPGQCFNLIKYATIVRQAAARHGTRGALEYDREFRMKKALYPNKPFQLIDGELYYSVLIPAGLQQNYHKRFQSGHEMPFVNTGPQQPFRTGPPQPFRTGPQSANRMPVGVCWAFNKGNCDKFNCAHPHKCAICGRTNHGQQRCFFRDRPQPQQSHTGERQQSRQDRPAQ